jgi:hypothetical protein
MMAKGKTAEQPVAIAGVIGIASRVLVRMRGMAPVQATRFLSHCTSEEVSAISKCKTGQELVGIMDDIMDRQDKDEAKRTAEA